MSERAQSPWRAARRTVSPYAERADERDTRVDRFLLAAGAGLKRPFSGALGRAAAVAALVTLPFLLWNPTAFLFSVVTSQGGVPFRPDALSFPAWLGGAHEQRWSLLSVGALAGAILFASWRSARTPAGFAGALALLYFGFFSFGGHAFANHYYFILGLICIAAAAAKLEPEPSVPPEHDSVLTS